MRSIKDKIINIIIATPLQKDNDILLIIKSISIPRAIPANKNVKKINENFCIIFSPIFIKQQFY